MGGVYKLVAVRDRGTWLPAIKVSEGATKTPNPGNKTVWRLYDARGKATADLLGLQDEHPPAGEPLVLRDPVDRAKRRELWETDVTEVEPLLVDVLSEGELVCELPTIEQIREVRRADVRRLDPGVRRLMNPHIYHVSLTERLWNLKQELLSSAMGKSH